MWSIEPNRNSTAQNRAYKTNILNLFWLVGSLFSVLIMSADHAADDDDYHVEKGLLTLLWFVMQVIRVFLGRLLQINNNKNK